MSRRDARGLNRKERPPRYDPETERKLSVKVVSYGDLGTNWSRRRRSVSRVTGTRGHVGEGRIQGEVTKVKVVSRVIAARPGC